MGRAASEFFQFLGNFTPGWAVTILFVAIVAYRMPSIIKEVFTGVREHKRVSAEIERQQDKVDREVAQKLRAQARRAPKP